MNDYTELLIKGAVIGHLIGDSLGYANIAKEKLYPHQVQLVDSILPAGTYTFKSAQMLAVISSIVDSDGINPEDIAEKLYEIYVGGYLTPDGECDDIGLTTVQSVKNHANGMSYNQCGLKEEIYNDSECLTRMLGIGLYCANKSVDELILKSHEVCAITHASVKSQVVCALYSLIIRNIYLQKNEKAFELLLDYYKTKEMKEYYDSLQNLKEWKKENTLSGDQTLEDTFWTTWTTFAQYPDDYSDAVSNGLVNSKNRNTIGSLIGSLSGLSNGLNEIPTKWLDKIRLPDEVLILVTEFIKLL